MGVVLDVILIALGILCVVTGFISGAVRSLIGLAGLVVGAWLAPGAGKWIAGLFTPGDLLGRAFLQIVCTIAAFLVILFLVRLAGKLLDMVCKLPVLHLINRLLGGAVGAVKGVLLVLVLSMLLQFLLPVLAQKYPDTVKLQSFSGSQLVRLPQGAQQPGWVPQAGNPLSQFYQQILREGIYPNAQEE